jgi:hypothetical protein
MTTKRVEGSRVPKTKANDDKAQRHEEKVDDKKTKAQDWQPETRQSKEGGKTPPGAAPARGSLTPAANPNAPKPLDALLVQHNFRTVTADGRVTAAEGRALRSTMTELSPQAQSEMKLRYHHSRDQFDADARAPMEELIASQSASTASAPVLPSVGMSRGVSGGRSMVHRPDGVLVKVGATAAAPQGSRTATLQWDKNTEADLAGYRVYMGSSPGVFTHVYEVASKDANSFELNDLGLGTYFFSITAYDTANNESAFSTSVAKAILK